jgi:hypothetical protein
VDARQQDQHALLLSLCRGFPAISDDTLIMPKWIESAQARSIKRDRRPHLDIDVARFSEDETMILLREGGWVRAYRSHSKADTMPTTGHVAKANADINAESDLHDLVDAQVCEVGLGAGVLDRLVELNLPVAGDNGGLLRSESNSSSTVAPRTTGRSGRSSRQARSTQTQTTTSWRRSRARSSGRSTREDESRSSPRTTWASVGFRRRIGPTSQRSHSHPDVRCTRSTSRITLATASPGT